MGCTGASLQGESGFGGEGLKAGRGQRQLYLVIFLPPSTPPPSDPSVPAAERRLDQGLERLGYPRVRTLQHHMASWLVC